MQETFKFKLDEVWPGQEGYGWQRIVGGYKLYDSEQVDDRWFFNLAVELPESLLKQRDILYQWIAYQDTELNFWNSGAVGCKVTIGEPAASQVDQWVGVTDLSSYSDQIIGKTWTEQ